MQTRLVRLHDLIADDADLMRQFDDLEPLIDHDAASLAADLSPVEARFADGRLPQPLAAGIVRTATISGMVDRMLEHERTLLAGTRDATEQRISELLGSGMVIRGGFVVLLIIVYYAVRRGARRSEELATARFDALQASEQRFHRMFEQCPVGIVLAEPDGVRVVQANPAFCRLLGYDAETVTGKALADFIHVDDRGAVPEAVEAATTPDMLGVEARHVTRNGTVAWTRIRMARMGDAGDRSALLLALISDLTREKRVEAELRQAQKMEAIGQLTGGIAHDFNNLLGVIIGNVEFLIDAAQNPTQADMAKEILDSALSGADLTRRLLAFARRQTLQPQRIDLNAYLPNHIAIMRRLLTEPISIRTTLAADLWPIRADPSQIGDALLNLAINARDAMPHGGTISITTGNVHLGETDADDGVAPGDYVVLSVTDTGTGMPPEVLERAVEPFFSTKGPGAGSGLGLSMTFGFAKQSGGHLKIESEPGFGTTVRLYLPRTVGPDICRPAEAREAVLLHGKEAILLVDDNVEMRAVTRRHLATLGYQVSEAGSGPAALEMLHNRSGFNLLFTDVLMPDGMTGYQLAAAARQLRPELKVLFTTGYFRSDEPPEMAARMIRKPYRRQELAAAVRAALEA